MTRPAVLNRSHGIGSSVRATLNVLFDHWRGKDYKPHVVLSQERYRAQLALFASMNLDIIALNEVTPRYVELLQKQPWVQDSYLCSDLWPDCSTMSPTRSLCCCTYPKVHSNDRTVTLLLRRVSLVLDFLPIISSVICDIFFIEYGLLYICVCSFNFTGLNKIGDKSTVYTPIFS